MLKEDFKEITEEHLNSAEIIVRYNGDCGSYIRLSCGECPFNMMNTKLYHCANFSNKEFTTIAKRFISTFGDK